MRECSNPTVNGHLVSINQSEHGSAVQLINLTNLRTTYVRRSQVLDLVPAQAQIREVEVAVVTVMGTEARSESM